jgi:hypothetical protein
MTPMLPRHQRANAGRGNRLWGEEPPNGSVPPRHLSGRCWLGYQRGVGPDKAEFLPVRTKFSCAYAPFISLSPFTDFGYTYAKLSGALSLYRAEATKDSASRMAVSWACSRSERAAAGASGFARGIPRLCEPSGPAVVFDTFRGVRDAELLEVPYRSEARNFDCLLGIHRPVPGPQIVSPGGQ